MIPRRTKNRARAACLWMLGSIVAASLTVGLLIDQRWVDVRDPEYVMRESRLKELIKETPERPLVLALGSSRVANGLRPQRVMNALGGEAIVFNCGIPKSGPFLQRIYLERLWAEGVRPDYLIFEVMPAFLDERQVYNELRFMDSERLDAHEIAQLGYTPSTLGSSWKKWTASRVLPFPRYSADVCETLAIDFLTRNDEKFRENSSIDPLGWRARDCSPEERPQRIALAHAQYDAAYQNFRLSVAAVKRLEQLLDFSKSRGIPVAILLMPEGSEFRDRTGDEMKEALNDLMDRCRRDHNATVIDARTWITDDGLYDMHHLSPAGAAAFSDRLAREGLPELLAKGRASARALNR
ncbi:MAG: DUF1574 domain-containing protein [Planctomycetes bacterium]|nr:DUF1574 domain-containing protein [Planctomycetota bacterium]